MIDGDMALMYFNKWMVSWQDEKISDDFDVTEFDILSSLVL